MVEDYEEDLVMLHHKYNNTWFHQWMPKSERDLALKTYAKRSTHIPIHLQRFEKPKPTFEDSFLEFLDTEGCDSKDERELGVIEEIPMDKEKNVNV